MSQLTTRLSATILMNCHLLNVSLRSVPCVRESKQFLLLCRFVMAARRCKSTAEELTEHASSLRDEAQLQRQETPAKGSTADLRGLS